MLKSLPLVLNDPGSLGFPDPIQQPADQLAGLQGELPHQIISVQQCRGRYLLFFAVPPGFQQAAHDLNLLLPNLRG